VEDSKLETTETLPLPLMVQAKVDARMNKLILFVLVAVANRTANIDGYVHRTADVEAGQESVVSLSCPELSST
jgi:hypothetical protein